MNIPKLRILELAVSAGMLSKEQRSVSGYACHFASITSIQAFADLLTHEIEQASQHKAICDCGDSIEPETGAVCGNCASETQGNLERLIEERQQASQSQSLFEQCPSGTSGHGGAAMTSASILQGNDWRDNCCGGNCMSFRCMAEPKDEPQ